MGKKKKIYSSEMKRVARISKALSHPARLYILEFLTRNKCSYSSDIADNLPLARSTISQHLSELKSAGLITGEIQGPYIKYCVDDKAMDDARKMYKAFLGR